MEENRLMSQNMSTWNTRKLKLMTNNTQECNSPNSDDKVKVHKEEEHSENLNGDEIESETRVDEITGRERLKRHREEMKGKVKVPENWEKEKMLKDWIDYTTFDAALFAPHRMIVTARDALVADVRKARSQRLRIHT